MLPNSQAISMRDRLSIGSVPSGCETSDLKIRLRNVEREHAALLSLCARQNDAIIRMRAGLVSARSAILFLKRDPFVLVESELTNMRLASGKLLEFATTATANLEAEQKKSAVTLMPRSFAPFRHDRTDTRWKRVSSTMWKVLVQSVDDAAGMLTRVARYANALLPTRAQRAVDGCIRPLTYFRHKVTTLLGQLWAVSEV